jgi:transcription termination factor Rho
MQHFSRNTPASNGAPQGAANGQSDQPDLQESPGNGGAYTPRRGEGATSTAERRAEQSGKHINISELEGKTLSELRDLARDLDLSGYTALKKQDLIFRLLQAYTEQQGNIFSVGLLEIVDEGFGFLRPDRITSGSTDVYVSQTQIRRFGIRTSDMVSGQVRPPKESEKFYGLLRVEAVNGIDPEAAKRRPHFDNLTPIFPTEMLNLETSPQSLTGRLINLVAPIGRGQRALVVSPPKAGKTLMLKAIANAITTNHTDIHMMIALIAERPEEVTDMKRSVKAEVFSATFDEAPEMHIRVAEMVLERAKRLVEGGRDVVILLDGITRLTRAYNQVIPQSGRTLSGGMDPSALYPPKRFFGAARNIEEGGSLTIIATCLVDTGSRMDDVIYEEFKGTGNSEITLDRKLSERRVFPAIDIARSSTRREEQLLDEKTLRAVVVMRRMFSSLAEQRGMEAMEAVLSSMSKTKDNQEFLANLNQSIR